MFPDKQNIMFPGCYAELRKVPQRTAKKIYIPLVAGYLAFRQVLVNRDLMDKITYYI